jgi:hypothetical protein
VTYREGLTAGAFGAAALLLPFLFHVLQLGHIFMPMYIPLVALAFYVSPAVAATTAFLVPLLSSVLTGMPPLYPPIAPIMALELAFMAGAIALSRRRLTTAPAPGILFAVLIAGKMLHVGLVYAASLAMHLPAGFLAGVSVLTGWPGVLLMIVVIPILLRARPPQHVQPEAGTT